MNYEQAINFIHSTNKFGSVLGLDNINELLRLIGNPQENLKVIHIAGTNGKGSISTMLNAVLSKSGYKTGLYTSPFLEKFNERIKINGIDISNEDIAYYVSVVKDKIDIMIKNNFPHPTEFEIITAAALLYFKEKDVDIVILEVGLGGRLDATNVVNNPLISVIASISFDHVEQLGNTLKKIAYEKGGIIKTNSNVVIYPSDKEAVDELIKISKEKNASFYLPKKEDIELIESSFDGSKIKYRKTNPFRINEFKLSLLGKNQVYNALTVLQTLEVLYSLGYKIKKEDILTALENIHFNGRFEIFSKNPIIILDGGHNKEGIESFVNNLNLYFEDKKIILFFGMLADKDIDSSLKKLLPKAEKIYTVTPNNNRALSSKDMYEKIKQIDKNAHVSYITDTSKSIELIEKDSEYIYAFVGSLYLIGEIRTLLRHANY